MPQPDYTTQYNTNLTPQEETQFAQWAREKNLLRDLYDYDMRGAWKAGAAQSEEGHFPDTFKKPNHPTFSVESQYHNEKNLPGGTWGVDSEGRTTFTPSAFNLQNMSPNELRQYFFQVEPSAVLKLPKTR